MRDLCGESCHGVDVSALSCSSRHQSCLLLHGLPAKHNGTWERGKNKHRSDKNSVN